MPIHAFAISILHELKVERCFIPGKTPMGYLSAPRKEYLPRADSSRIFAR
jgi:hypothetical protein